MISTLSRVWDWIDRRDIDKHAVCWATLVGLMKITLWAMWFADHSERPGLDVAAIVGAVTAPYMLLVNAVVRYYFESRPTS